MMVASRDNLNSPFITITVETFLKVPVLEMEMATQQGFFFNPVAPMPPPRIGWRALTLAHGEGRAGRGSRLGRRGARCCRRGAGASRASLGQHVSGPASAIGALLPVAILAPEQQIAAAPAFGGKALGCCDGLPEARPKVVHMGRPPETEQKGTRGGAERRVKGRQG